LPQDREIEADELTYPPQRLLDFAVDGASLQADEPGGKPDEQFLESRVLPGASRRVPVRWVHRFIIAACWLTV
jgi:hypothetical protein